MTNLLKIPKVQMFLSLLLIAILAIAGDFSWLLILRYLAIFAFTLGLEYLLWIIRGVSPFFPSASFVTATIIFLISDPSTIIVFPLIAVIFAVLQKQFVRIWGSHIFNPAAFGLFISSYLGNSLSWWGPNVSLLTLFATILAAGYVSQIKIRQWKITAPFLVATFLGLFIKLGSLQSVIPQFTVGSFWFFCLVMLPEPITAAKGNWTKPVYGIFAALLPFAFLGLPIISDLQLTALILSNLIFRLVDRYLEIRSVAVSVKIPPAPQTPAL